MGFVERSNLDLPPLLKEVADRLIDVRGISAVVLGGSRARGTERPGSDYDIGVYYDRVLDSGGVASVAAAIALPDSKPEVTSPYTWGRWVNGGAWIDTAIGRVDILYRNLVDIRRVLDQSIAGKYEHDFDQQPSFGFRSYNYLGEIIRCLPLLDPKGAVAKLKKDCQAYPVGLQRNVMNNSLFSAEFSVYHLKLFVQQRDFWNASATKTRILFYVLQALFALNREYWFGDKGAIDRAEKFSLVPKDFRVRIERGLSTPLGSVIEIEHLLAETRELAHAVEL